MAVIVEELNVGTGFIFRTFDKLTETHHAVVLVDMNRGFGVETERFSKRTARGRARAVLRLSETRIMRLSTPMIAAVASQNQMKTFRNQSTEFHADWSPGRQIDVPAASNGLDAFLLAIISAQFTTQIAHVHIDTAVHGRHRPREGRLSKFFAADNLAGLA